MLHTILDNIIFFGSLLCDRISIERRRSKIRKEKRKIRKAADDEKLLEGVFCFSVKIFTTFSSFSASRKCFSLLGEAVSREPRKRRVENRFGADGAGTRGAC